MSNSIQLSLFNPIIIPLTKGYTTLIDPIDADLCELKWCAQETKYGKPYAQRTENKHAVLMHRVILSRILGRELLHHEHVDHIDLNPLNNQRYNLRLATPAGNSQNQRKSKRNTSGYKGVEKSKNRWRAIISANGRKYYLGQFLTKEGAFAAYCEAAKKYHGEFARFD